MKFYDFDNDEIEIIFIVISKLVFRPWPKN